MPSTSRSTSSRSTSSACSGLGFRRDDRGEQTRAPFATVEEAIEDIRQGRFVVVVDAEDRENEGDLTIAAQFATPEAINFMATHARGLICLCLTPERCDELGLEQMARENETPLGTAFTVSVEAREGVTTGISAHDRAHTIQVAIDPSKGAHDLVRPGHVFPLRARARRRARALGPDRGRRRPRPARRPEPGRRRLRDHERGRDDGPRPDLAAFCAQHEVKLLTIADLIEYRRRTERLVERVAEVRLPTAYGEFTAVAFRETLTGKPHVALVKGELDGAARTCSCASTPSA